MPTVQVPAQLTVEHLIDAVQQLSPDERREFQQRLAEWEAHNGHPEETEAQLLATIRDNSRLPTTKQRRFNRLRRKRQDSTLTEAEQVELQDLWQRVEQMSVSRLEALTRLAHRRGTAVRTLMHELGFPENPGVF